MKGVEAGHRIQLADTALAEQMLTLGRSCVSKPGELAIDLDSGLVLARNAGVIYKALHHQAGLEAAKYLEINVAWERSDPVALTQLFRSGSPLTYHYITRLISVCYSRSKQPGAIDSAFHYAMMFQRLAKERNSPDEENEANYYIGLTYKAMGNLPKFKEHFLAVTDYLHKKKDDAGELGAWQIFDGEIGWTDTTHPERLDVLPKVIALERKLGLVDKLVQTLYAQGDMYFFRGRMKDAERAYMEADERYVAKSGISRYAIYEMLTKINLANGNAEKALHYGQAALDDALKVKDNVFLHNIYRARLGEVYSNFGNTRQYYENMATITDGGPPEQYRDYFYILTHAGLVNYRQGPQAALKYLEERGSKVPNTTPLHQAGYKKLKGQYHLATGELTLAKAELLEAAKIVASLGDGAGGLRGDIYMYLTQLSIRAKAFDEAEQFLLEIDRVPKTMITLHRQMTIELMRYRIDSARGDYFTALKRYTLHKLLSDSVFNLEKLGQMEELNLKYATAQQQQLLDQRTQEVRWLTDRALLRDALLETTRLTAAQRDSIQDQHLRAARNEARLQGDSLHHAQETNRYLNSESNLQKKLLAQARVTRNLIVAGVLLLALLLILIYSRYRLKQRSNRQLQKQQELIEQKNKTLEKLLDEKVWLLREVHHRVKNNLQVVTSLLNTQSYYLQDDAAIAAIRDSQRRVNAISLIHKKLYQSDNPAMVDMEHYIQELVAWLQDSSDDRRNIHFVLDVAPITLDIAKALPIGLILNEAVTNAYKYAFTDAGTIAIRLLPDGDDDLLLTIADNGKGISVIEEEGKPPSLGMSLMQGLARDIEGVFELENRQGTIIAVRFPKGNMAAAVVSVNSDSV